MKFGQISDSDGMMFKGVVIAGRRDEVQLVEMSRPVPPARPVGQGVWEKVKTEEWAEGVAVLPVVIHVSVKTKTLSFDLLPKAGMK